MVHTSLLRKVAVECYAVERFVRLKDISGSSCVGLVLGLVAAARREQDHPGVCRKLWGLAAQAPRRKVWVLDYILSSLGLCVWTLDL